MAGWQAITLITSEFILQNHIMKMLHSEKMGVGRDGGVDVLKEEKLVLVQRVERTPNSACDPGLRSGQRASPSSLTAAGARRNHVFCGTASGAHGEGGILSPASHDQWCVRRWYL